MPSQMYGDVKTCVPTRSTSAGWCNEMAPMVFMPLLRETLPSGPNRIIRNIRTKVFRCKPADDVMRCGTVGRTGRKDATGAGRMNANPMSWYENYFTRFAGETEMWIATG